MVFFRFFFEKTEKKKTCFQYCWIGTILLNKMLEHNQEKSFIFIMIVNDLNEIW